MKVYLIQPPIEDFYATPIRNIPHGLLSLAANLKQHEVHLLDLRLGKRQRIEIPPELAPVSQFYRPDDVSPFGLYRGYYRFGFSSSEMRQAIPDDGDVYLISSLFTTYADTVYEVIRIIREIAPRAKIIAGGAHPTIMSEEVLKNGADFIIRAEGETALPRLLFEIEKNQPDYSAIFNLSWRNPDGTPVHNPIRFIENLDELPFADYRTSGTPVYYYRKKPHAMLIASRGCPYHCAFCCIHQTMGNRYRVRSVNNVLAELSEKVAQGFRSFDFEDDHLGGDRDWFLALLHGIRERFEGLDLSLHAMNGITASNLDAEVLAAMWSAGFRSLNLALVTPYESWQKRLRRPFGTDKYLGVVAEARRLGFFITTYLIIGLPGDRAEELLQALLFLAPLQTLIGPSLFYLVPGTSMHRRLKAGGLIPDSYLCYRSSFYPIEGKDCNRLAAMTLFRISRVLNFMRAVIDTDPMPRFKIGNEIILTGSGINLRGRPIDLGLGLLKLLFERGKIYGAGHRQNDSYPIIEEECDPRLLRLFIDSNWKIGGLHSTTVLEKSAFVERYLCN